ncbi:MAG: DUF5683 domain-containing protein [Saprospiraceae bacterium]
MNIYGQTDSTAHEKNTIKDSLSMLPNHKPRTAFLLGLGIPGGGQIYNKRWWKLPLVYGGYGGLVYFYNYRKGLFKEWNGYYEEAISTGKPVSVRPGLDWTDKQIKLYRDKFRDGRDVAIFAFVGVHLLVALEAYVDAHLKDFNIDEDLSLKLSPSNAGIGLVYNLH